MGSKAGSAEEGGSEEGSPEARSKSARGLRCPEGTLSVDNQDDTQRTPWGRTQRTGEYIGGQGAGHLSGVVILGDQVTNEGLGQQDGCGAKGYFIWGFIVRFS